MTRREYIETTAPLIEDIVKGLEAKGLEGICGNTTDNYLSFVYNKTRVELWKETIILPKKYSKKEVVEKLVQYKEPNLLTHDSSGNRRDCNIRQSYLSFASDEMPHHVDGIVDLIYSVFSVLDETGLIDSIILSNDTSEEGELIKQTRKVEEENHIGVYVYSFPHYLRHSRFAASDITDERFYLKIGMSDVNAKERVKQQTRITSFPEDPIILRVYTSDANPKDMERKFHDLLESAGHHRAPGKQNGKEWYVTNLKFLDKVAETLDYKIAFEAELR